MHKYKKYIFIGIIFFLLEIIGKSNMAQPKEVKLKIIADITYKTIPQQDLKLDIYKPLSLNSIKVPVVVYIHGGGWSTGDKSQIKKDYRRKMLHRLVNGGYAVVSINYRLTNLKDTHFPDPIVDCKDAIRWLRKNAETYSFDSANIGVWGSSAGGHLSLLLAYSQEKDFPGSNELNTYSSKVNYVINNFGPVDLNKLFRPETSDFLLNLLNLLSEEKYKKRQLRLGSFTGLDLKKEKDKIIEVCRLYSPMTYISKNSVPTITFHGDGDETVPLIQSKILNEKLKKYHVLHELVIYKGRGHGFRTLSEENIDYFIDRNIRFIKKVHESIEKAHTDIHHLTEKQKRFNVTTDFK